MSPKSSIDLNVDLGERADSVGTAEDLRMLDAITSANVACGFHAGDAGTMARICQAALARGVRVGAHIGYSDREAFGRRARDVDPAQLRVESVYQLGALAAIARDAGGAVTYVKPHGALYNRCAIDEQQARAVVEAIVSFDQALALLCPPSSVLMSVALEHGLDAVPEGFADRAYLADGRLMARTERGSVLTAGAALSQARQIALEHTVTASDGSDIPLPARSICVHSDTPGAVDLVHALRSGLAGAAVEIRPFT